DRRLLFEARRRSDGRGEQDRVLVSVAHHPARLLEALRYGPAQGPRSEPFREAPTNRRRQARIAGIVPVDVPAALDVEQHTDLEWLPRAQVRGARDEARVDWREVLRARRPRDEQGQQEHPSHPRHLLLAKAGRRNPPCRQDQESRCTVSGENAGRQTATYSAPSASGDA